MPYHAPLHWKIRVDKSKGDIGLSLTNNPSGVGVTVCGLNSNPSPILTRAKPDPGPGLTMA